MRTPGTTTPAARLERAADLDRIQTCLLYILNHPGEAPGWDEEVKVEARALGFVVDGPARIGCNCRPGIDRGIIYGGDMEDVF